LSAFVLTALLEANAKFPWIQSQKIKSAVQCVVFNRNSSDIYSLSLVNHAAHLAKSYNIFNDEDIPMEDIFGGDSLKLELLDGELESMDEVLQAAANTSLPGALFWDQPVTVGNRWWSYSRSTAIEMTAYNIMSLVLQDRLDEVVDAVKWLGRQRNGQGGFVSTQDTVLALQALSLYGASVGRFDTALNVKAKTDKVLEEYNLDPNNAQILNILKVPELPADVSFDLAGSGCALVQSVLRYNVPESKKAPSFSLKVENEKNQLSVCAAYTGQREKTDMVMLEVEMISGYEARNPDYLINEIDSGVQRVEVDEKENVVILYFDEFTKEQRCVNLKLERLFKIEETKPARVSIYDYYNVEERHDITYSLE